MDMKKMLLIAAVFLTFAVVTAGAQATTCPTIVSTTEPWYCPINQQIAAQWLADLPTAMIFIFLSFAIASIIFMVGVVFRSDRIRGFAVGEFYEAIATAIIIGAFLYLCAIIFGLIPGVTVGAINPYATAFNLMYTTVNTANQEYTALFSEFYAIDFTVTPQIQLEVLGESTGTTKAILGYVGLAPQTFINLYRIPVTIYFLDPTIAIAGFIVDGVAALWAEYYLLVFFSVAAIPAFLIPGIFFRSLFPTRALGGILIAIAFGFYLIMPALFSIIYYFTTPTVQRDMSSATLAAERLQYVDTSASSATSPLVQQLNNVKSSLNGFWLLIFFYPGLIMSITYAAIRQMAEFIGRSVNYSNRVRQLV